MHMLEICHITLIHLTIIVKTGLLIFLFLFSCLCYMICLGLFGLRTDIVSCLVILVNQHRIKCVALLTIMMEIQLKLGAYNSECSSIMNNLSHNPNFFRMMLWEELRKFELRVIPVNGLKHANWTVLPLEQIFHHSDSSLLPSANPPSILHSLAKQQKPSMMLVNSLNETSLKDNTELFMVSSSIHTSQPDRILQLAGRAYVINAKVDLDEVRDSPSHLSFFFNNFDVLLFCRFPSFI